MGDNLDVIWLISQIELRANGELTMRVFTNYTVSEGDIELLLKDTDNNEDVSFEEWDADVLSQDGDADAFIDEWDADYPVSDNNREIWFNDWKEFETNLDDILIHCREWEL